MSQRDILAEGEETIQPGDIFRTDWVATQGLRKIAISIREPSSANQPMVEESRDAVNVLLGTGLAFNQGWSHTEFVPAAAFFRLVLSTGSSAAEVPYSVRGIG